ncbi:bifunctional hydroxymethylpyrimidine kinase/phosphomethylpyrimidine kinase [Myxococcota bacterium]|nr:bifunctional hydroxymethylpyrimidine kinase/phosphomethylpyrimidine kinase [Myxococcota bacterium]
MPTIEIVPAEAPPVAVVHRAAVAVYFGELDPTGRAGLLADARAAAARAVRAAVVPTFLAGRPVPADEISAALEQVRASMPIDAVKAGRLGGTGTVRSVAEELAALAHPRLVVDPGFLDARGEPRVSDAVVAAFRAHLLPLALVVIVNVVEAERLFGRPCEDRHGMLEAAKRLFDDGPTWVVVTGGRREGHPVDLVFDGTGTLELGADRIPGLRLPHTGGTFTAVLAAELARGLCVPAALEAARAAVNPSLAGAARFLLHPPAIEPLAAHYAALGLDAAPVAVPVPAARGDGGQHPGDRPAP